MFDAQFIEKLSNTETELKRYVAYKKKRVRLRFHIFYFYFFMHGLINCKYFELFLFVSLVSLHQVGKTIKY